LLRFSEREKSATKEAINILHKFITASDDESSKRRKISAPEEEEEEMTDLSLVKLIRSGLILFTFPKDTSPDTVAIVSNIIQALDSGNLTLPL
jgi:hypothetical protein